VPKVEIPSGAEGEMSFYEKNLTQLKLKFPEVYEWILKAEEDKSIEVIHTAGGVSNLRLKGITGKSSYLYPMDDPLREEREFCKTLDFSADQVTFLVGIGLGYIIEAIREKVQKGHKIIVFEKSATILKKALHQTDFSDLLKEGGMIFSLPDEDSVREKALQYASDHNIGDSRIIGNARLMDVRKEYFELKELVVKYTTSSLVNHSTTINNGPIFAKNEIANLPRFLFSSGIKHLYEKFKGIPGIIISAGPSLEKNIHRLKEAKGKALIIATAPVVRVLFAHNIKPDLIVSIDFMDENGIHFEGINDCVDIPLVYPIRLTPRIVKEYQGDMFAVQDFMGLFGWLQKNWEFKGSFTGGGSVAIYAIMLALFCGCDPVIFVGQDLAFTDRSHIDGVFLAEKVDRNNPNVLWVDGMYGEKVPTSPVFLSFLGTIEAMIKQFQDRSFLNCTEGGAKIQGAKILSFDEFLTTQRQEPVDIEGIIKKSTNIEKVNFRELLREIEEKINQLRGMLKLSIDGLRSNKKIKRKLGREEISSPEMRQALRENYQNSTTLQQFCESFAPMSLFINKEIFQINRQEYRFQSSHSDTKEGLVIGLKRNNLILAAAQKGIKEVYERLTHLFQILKRIETQRRKLAANDKDEGAHYQYGRVLSEIGCHRLAVEEYEKAMEQGREDCEIFYALGLSYLCLGKITMAEAVFQRAQKRFPEESLIQEGFRELEEVKKEWEEKAESYHQAKDWVNASLYARKLLREYPDHRRAEEIAKESGRLRDEKVRKVEEMHQEERKKRFLKMEHRNLMDRAKDFMGRKYYAQAMDCLERALHLGHDEVEVKSLLACCYSEAGEMDKASQVFEELVAQFPETGLFHFNLGRALIRNGRLEEAAGQLEIAASKEKQKFYNALFEAGAIYMNYKSYDRAIECFEKYLECSPDSYELLTKIGTCYLAQGRLSEARQKYQEALRIQPEYEAAGMGLKKIEEMEQRTRLERRPKSERLAV
jgi:Flp pilus assembly protein TadD